MTTFEELVASRRAWIDSVLMQWCRQAPLVELQKAAAEWTDIAGRADPAATLWTWAWSRYPVLVHEGLSGVDETHAVRLTLADGSVVEGYPDGRSVPAGHILLIGRSSTGQTIEHGPISLDVIAAAQRA